MVIFTCCPGGRLVGPTVDVGEFPHIFFPSPPMSADALLAPIRDHIAGLGFELVDLRATGTLQRPILQVRVDRPDSRPGQGVTADDCAVISRSLERFLESRAMVGPRYVLEVSSPGLERPLRWPEHWRRFVGRRARVARRALRGRRGSRSWRSRRRACGAPAGRRLRGNDGAGRDPGGGAGGGLERHCGNDAVGRVNGWLVRPRCWPRSAS